VNKTNDHLQWVERNRKTAHRPERIGDVARGVLVEKMRAGATWQRKIVSILAEHAGAGLLEQVRMVKLSCGVLYLVVDDQATLYQLRLQWEQRLLEILQEERLSSGIQAIRFTMRGHEH
jgi:hypothetical protein